MRIHPILVCGALAVVLGACDKPPELPGPPATQSAATSATASSSRNAPVQPSAYDLDNWKAEAPAIAASGGAIERRNFVLTLKSNGVPVANLRSDDSNDWIYVTSFAAACGGKPCTLYVFRYTVAGSDLLPYNLVVDETGRPVTWLQDQVVLGSGGWVASGSAYEQGSFEIDDLSSPRPVFYMFDRISCVPGRWPSPEEIAVTCHNDAITSNVTHDTVKKVSDHAWQFMPRGTRAVAEPVQPMDIEDLAALKHSGFARP